MRRGFCSYCLDIQNREHILNQMVKYTQTPEVLFDALSQSTRRKIFEHLSRGGTLSVSDIQEPLGISLPATLKQIRVLKESGLVTCQKKGRTQYCSLNRKKLNKMIDWLLYHQQFWSKSLDRLEKHLKENNKK